ncbi:MAG TPA: Ig-like domain-containing protein [Candidatus Acidoferrum sp.]|nr:Ig-like domain-containing protein [Candidatus Acidoferrum sp.]
MKAQGYRTSDVIATIKRLSAVAARGRGRPIIVLGLVGVLLLLGPWSVRSTEGQTTPIPQLALWESQMVSYGRSHCNALMQPGQTADQLLGSTYYDLTRVMYQIADYTGQSSWNDCARAGRVVYGNGYVLPNNGGVPGYWNFSTGLRMDFERTATADSRSAALLLSTNAAYSSDLAPLDWTASYNRSREVAYTILAYINAEALGAAPRARRIDLVNQAYGHLNQWFVTFDWVGTTDQMSAFMVGLTAHALIRDWWQTQDPRLIPALRLGADWLWAHAWDAGSQSMFYQVNPSDTTELVNGQFNPAPDLNLLIAPMYAFLYAQTGETKYRDRGDALFTGGVTSAFLTGAKQFNQNYWWSFDYVHWRTAGGTLYAPSLSVSVTAPTSGMNIQGTVAVAAAASTTATRVDLRLNGSLVATYSGSVSNYSWNTKTVPNGTHRWVARAYNSTGTIVDSPPVDVVVNNSDLVPPVVELDKMAVTVLRKAMVSISATASDNVGVVKVEFYVNGALLCSDTASPYTCSWKVPAATVKSYVLQAKAFDAAGNVGLSAPVGVSVRGAALKVDELDRHDDSDGDESEATVVALPVRRLYEAER